MRKFYIILVFTIFTTSLFAKDWECSQEARFTLYNDLETDVTQLIGALPTLTDSKKSFFQRAGFAYYNNHKDNYQHIVVSNDFISYNNSAQLSKLLNAVQNAISSNEAHDLYDEIKMIAKINHNFLLNAVAREGYLDSKLMFEREIVDDSYNEIAKNLLKSAVKINDCSCAIVFTLKNR